VKEDPARLAEHLREAAELFELGSFASHQAAAKLLRQAAAAIEELLREVKKNG
jgi:aspartokinase-like uncharacterized kinase